MPRAFSSLAWLTLAFTTACQGDILGGGATPGVPGAVAGSPSATAGATGVAGTGEVPEGITAGPQPLRRLTRVEYENTVRDLLKLAQAPISGLPSDARGAGGFPLAGPVGEVDAEVLQDFALELASAAVEAGLPVLMGCSFDGGNEVACTQQFIKSFGRRAFRRPLTAVEVSDLEALFQNARQVLQLSGEESVALLLAAILQAPQFLYLWERTSADDPSVALVALTADEVASRLSYLLRRSMPDAALFDAVDTGRLTTPDDVTREARRLVADEAAQDSLVEFVRGWFHLPSRRDDALSNAANGETELFVKSVLASGGSLGSLLTSPTNFVNATLAPLYGATNVVGDELRPLVVNPEQRFGLLTQLSFLGSNADGAQSHPVKRGAVIYNQLLCGELPPLPDDVPQPGPQQEGVPNRVRFSAHSQNACAVGCHRILDPLGFAFESYDGTGRFRTMDGGAPIDASGSLQLPSGSLLAFQNARELVEQLAVSPEVRDCATKQALRLALGRRDRPEDAASLAQVASAFAAAQFDLRELFVAAVTTPSFAYRTVSTP